jgi:hypothetical protein
VHNLSRRWQSRVKVRRWHDQSGISQEGKHRSYRKVALAVVPGQVVFLRLGAVANPWVDGAPPTQWVRVLTYVVVVDVRRCARASPKNPAGVDVLSSTSLQVCSDHRQGASVGPLWVGRVWVPPVFLHADDQAIWRFTSWWRREPGPVEVVRVVRVPVDVGNERPTVEWIPFDDRDGIVVLAWVFSGAIWVRWCMCALRSPHTRSYWCHQQDEKAHPNF